MLYHQGGLFPCFLFFKKKKRKIDFIGKFFSLLSFASPKERSKEKEPEIDVQPDFGTP
jgi:hypothetical protein